MLKFFAFKEMQKLVKISTGLYFQVTCMQCTYTLLAYFTSPFFRSSHHCVTVLQLALKFKETSSNVPTGDAALTCMDLSPVTPASCASAISKGSGWFVVSAAAWSWAGRGPAHTVCMSSCSSKICSRALVVHAWTGKCHINEDRSVTACGYLDLAHVFETPPNILHNESISARISSQTWYYA